MRERRCEEKRDEWDRRGEEVKGEKKRKNGRREKKKRGEEGRLGEKRRQKRKREEEEEWKGMSMNINSYHTTQSINRRHPISFIQTLRNTMK